MEHAKETLRFEVEMKSKWDFLVFKEREKIYCDVSNGSLGVPPQVVDMRWGVRDEMTNEHMTTDLCMTELTNCQRLSMGPNFIFFGGQKYGYRPIPTEIITSELAQLREVLGNNSTHLNLLNNFWISVTVFLNIFGVAAHLFE